MTDDTDNSRAPKQPADVIPDRNLKATIWRNEGEKGSYYATEFSRTYTDGEGNLRDASSFIATDLLRVSELARKAYDRTAELRREEFKEKRRAQAARRPERSRDQRSR
ncbi:hypothetical protein KAJ83_04500 [Marivibrio halodurans]|uniref:Uncharacterized protein n=1 Tax=Marivibrio halodurans TaxID=2039722 RepID=A0A8J7S062_9PROT|nr:hypothetical protein [Marivibrio halodurans]MBP5856258.1 hypothetical protein [Marivibrio halodurans]